MSGEGLDRTPTNNKAGSLKRILLVEDNPADVYLIREAILDHARINDLQFLVVTDGEQAIDFVLRRNSFAGAARPDLIVLDLNLPKSDGVDVLRCIRERSDLLDVPVVVLTSSDSAADRSATERLGANNFITKPADLDAFMAIGGTLLSYVDRSSSSKRTSV
jgi:CheY-like chemotaxis protein